MDNIRQESPNEGTVLNVNNQEIWQFLNKRFRHTRREVSQKFNFPQSKN